MSKDTSGTDALAAELKRIVEQAEALMAAAGTDNATIDALKQYNVRHINMPATPQKLWSIIQGK